MMIPGPSRIRQQAGASGEPADAGGHDNTTSNTTIT